MNETGGSRVPGLARGRVRIRPTTRSDLEHLARWWSDPEIMTPVLRPGGISMSPEEWDRWFGAWCSDTSGPQRHFIVFDEHDTPIGEIYYHDLDGEHRRASIGIKIGAPNLWGKGYAVDAVDSFCTYLFDMLGIGELVIEVAPSNKRALAFWRKLGFTIYARSPASVNMRLQASTFRSRDTGGHSVGN